MDSNGVRSFGLVQGAGLYVRDVLVTAQGQAGERTPSLEVAGGHRVGALRLASLHNAGALIEEAQRIEDVVVAPSMALDADGSFMRLVGGQLVSSSPLAARHGLQPRPFALPAGLVNVLDMALGDDGVLYLAGSGALWLIDLRARFVATRIEPPAGFAPQRLAARPGGGVWVFDLAAGRIARHTGRPPFTRGLVVGDVIDRRFAAAEPSSDPSCWWQPLGDAAAGAAVPAAERAIAISANARGEVLLLSLRRAGGGALLRLLFDEAKLSPALGLAGPKFPATAAWLTPDHMALAARAHYKGRRGERREAGAFVFELAPALREALRDAARGAEGGAEGGEPGAAAAQPVFDTLLAEGDYRPLSGWTGEPFCNAAPGQPLHYPRLAGGANGTVQPARLARIATTQRLRHGWAANVPPATLREDAGEPSAPDEGFDTPDTPDLITADADVPYAVGRIDSGDPSTVWHRLHAEAVLPEGCALVVWLAAGSGGPPTFTPGAGAQAGWHAHLFGDAHALPAATELPTTTPRAAWCTTPSEAPYGQGLMGCPPQQRPGGACGRFEVLIQRAGLAVRSLQGARLWVVIEFFGDGRLSPELVALRAGAGRVSYRDRYLPALYHERTHGIEADQHGSATGADFLDRLLHLFEGLFTSLEDRIAAAALLTDAHACPGEALPWLAEWLGIVFDTPLPEPRLRRLVAQSGPLAREHGTLRGLHHMLDLLTDGGLSRGRVVIVEDFRLRRTLATILGADLVDHDDPLTAGLSRGGQSVVGETLFLGDRAALDAGALKTFLALFRRLEGEHEDEIGAAHKALFDGLAHRVTVLVHETSDDDEFGRITRLAERFAPAHVLTRTLRATSPFIAGVASLAGADSYLRAPPPERPVRLHPHAEGSRVGNLDTLRGAGSLDAHAGALDDVLAPAGGAPPEARIRLAAGDPAAHDPQRLLRLDGSPSIAAPGRRLRGWQWRQLPPR